MAPAAYVKRMRVERAQQALETSDASIERIAARCGFGIPETMRRAFSEQIGVTPAEYHQRPPTRSVS